VELEPAIRSEETVRSLAGLSGGAHRRRRSLADLPDIVPMAVVAVLGVLVVYARCPVTLRVPELYGEDGNVWFLQAYAHGALRPLFSPDAGYLQTLPRLVADIGLLVPLVHLPRLFVTFALVVEVLPACFLVSRRMSGVIPSFWVRVAFAAAYLCIPNSREINAELTNAQWHLALLLFLVVVAAEGGWLWRVFDVVVAVVGGLTGPFVLAIAPIAVVVYLLRRRRWSAVMAALLMAAAVVQGVAWLTTRSARAHFGYLGVTASRLLQILGGEVVGGTAVGPPVTQNGIDGHLLRCGLLLGAAVVIVALAMWRGPMELRALNLFAGAMLAAGLLAPMVVVSGSQWQVIISAADSGGRYLFLPTCALVADVLWAACQLWGRRNMRPVGAVGLVCLVGVAGFGMRNSFSYTPNNPRPDWVAQVRAFDRLPPGHSFTFQETPAGWSFTLIKR
jgi:hypothetical protein